MDEILRSLNRCQIPSIRGTMYSVTVVQGKHVTVSHSRRMPSVLPWNQVELVYNAACSGTPITPKTVDKLRQDHPASHDGSTMCALVLAMRDPLRASHI
jgi:hypothetical protein